MKTLTSALLISLLAFSQIQIASAGTRTASASFQTTFVIAEACAVESGAAKPVVSCQYNSPFQVQAAAASAATAGIARADGQVMTVTF
jgi:hypothetical protein